MSEAATRTDAGRAGGGLYLRNLWYMAALAALVPPGAMQRVILLEEPWAIGRTKAAVRFTPCAIFAASRRAALGRQDQIRQQRRMPLSWLALPHRRRLQRHSLPGRGPDLDPNRIRVRAYPVREQDGLIWVYMAAKPGTAPQGRAAQGADARQPRSLA